MKTRHPFGNYVLYEISVKVIQTLNQFYFNTVQINAMQISLFFTKIIIQVTFIQGYFSQLNALNA
jgi:hypothetical protein